MTGINRYSDKLTTKEVSEKSGVDVSNLRNAIRGNRGLSLKASRQVAPLFDADPLSLYVESQCRAIKTKLEKGEGKAAVLRAVAAVHDELKGLTRQELTDAGEELRAAVVELTELAEEALKADDIAPDVPAKDKAAKKSRDAAGRRYEEPSGKVERDALGKRMLLG